MSQGNVIGAKLLAALQRDLVSEIGIELHSNKAKMISGMWSEILGYVADETLNPRADDNRESEAERLFREPAAVEETFNASLQQIGQQEIEATPERMDKLLAAKFDGGKTVRIERIAGGFSKDSFFFDYEDAEGILRKTVIRRDMPFGPNGYTVLDEYALLQRMYAENVGVARPIACIEDVEFLGQPFLISELVPGITQYDVAEPDKQKRDAIWKQLGELVARLHSLPPERSGLVPAADPQQQLRDYVLWWKDRWERHMVDPSFVLENAFEWLLANIPAHIDRIAIVHADISFTNILVDEGGITALLDWEFCHLGDPVEDLAYFRQFVTDEGDWENFLQSYEQSGGVRYKPENAHFYEVWRAARNTVCCSSSWWGFVNDKYSAPKMAYMGVVLYRRFLKDLALQLDLLPSR